MSRYSTAKPHIAILIHSMNDGGAQKRVVSLANGFAARGHAVDLVAVEGAGKVGRLAAPEVRQIALRPATARADAAARRRAGRAQGLSRARAAGGADGGVEPRACPRRARLRRHGRPAAAGPARGAASAAPPAVVAAVEADSRIWASADRALGVGHRRPDHRGQPGKRGGDRRARRRSRQGHRHPQPDDHRAFPRLARHARRASLVRRGRRRRRPGHPGRRADHPAKGFRDAGRGHRHRQSNDAGEADPARRGQEAAAWSRRSSPSADWPGGSSWWAMSRASADG